MSALTSAIAPITASSTTSVNADRATYSFLKQPSQKFDVLKEVYKQQIEPFHGDQTSALSLIEKGADRRWELLERNQVPVGLLVYKTEKQNPAETNLSESLEIKQILVIDNNSETKDKILTHLFNRIVRLAAKNHAKSLHITTSYKIPGLIQFLESKGFLVSKFWEHRKRGTEKLLYFKTDHLTASPTISPHETPKQKDNVAAKRKRNDLEDQNDRDDVKKRTSVASTPAVLPTQSSAVIHRAPPPTFQLVQSTHVRQNFQSHELTLKQKYVQQILSGKKTIEGRINAGVVLKYRVGDQIKFFNQTSSALCKIKAIRNYRGFREMLESEGVQKCLTDVSNLDAAVKVYHDIPSYQDRASRSGVTAIEIELIR